MPLGLRDPATRSRRQIRWVGSTVAALAIAGVAGTLVVAAGGAESARAPADDASSAAGAPLHPGPAPDALRAEAPEATPVTATTATAVTTTAPAASPAPSLAAAVTAPAPTAVPADPSSTPGVDEADPGPTKGLDEGPVALGASSGPAQRHDFGTSVEGRPLTAWSRAGSDRPTRRELVVGVIHGEEPAGRAITDLLLATPLPPELELWVIPTINPDGESVGQRGNANGVDLNRNFPTGWLPPGSDPYTSGGYHSGAGPASEPEVQAAMALIRALRPQRTIWYHQPWDEVICEPAHAGRACTDYASRVGRPAGPAGRPGSAIGWQQAEDLGAALVVELAEGPPSAETVQLHASAVVAGW